ncbi:hypothetical protein ACFVUY_19020 [Kitasatospora sp. NPDC058063]|uniref:hypothetical protein n=1 Tax=unclassified Kitasatospora TaxID=2633591 RepID=UPI0036DE087E
MEQENAPGARPTGERAADDRAAEEWVRRHFGLVPEPQGSLTAFDGRLVVDLDTRLVTVDGREVQLARADVRLLRGLIELGEGVHQAYSIMWKVYNAALHPHELTFPMTRLRWKLGEPSWIVRTEEGYGLRPPELP